MTAVSLRCAISLAPISDATFATSREVVSFVAPCFAATSSRRRCAPTGELPNVGFVDDDSSPVCVCPSPHKFPASPASVVRRIAFPTLESAQVRSGNSEECDQRPSHEICTSTNGARDFCVMCVCPRVER
eukprot:1188585-Prorocentrum_minimum.AAC.1